MNTNRPPDLTITIPYLPPKELSPNWQPMSGRYSIWPKINARNQLRHDTFWLAIEVDPGPSSIGEPTFEHIEVRYTFMVPDKRRRDGDNYVARMKGAQDGLVRASIVKDDDFTHLTLLPPEFRYEKGKKETIIEIWGNI